MIPPYAGSYALARMPLMRQQLLLHPADDTPTESAWQSVPPDHVVIGRLGGVLDLRQRSSSGLCSSHANMRGLQSRHPRRVDRRRSGASDAGGATVVALPSGNPETEIDAANRQHLT
jgi:hypothetical protein